MMPTEQPLRQAGYRRLEFEDALITAIEGLVVTPANPTTPATPLTQAQIDQAVSDYFTAHPPANTGTGTASTGQPDLVLPVEQTGQTVFTLPAGNLRTVLFVTGVKENPAYYTISGTTLTWQGPYPLDARDELVLSDHNTVDRGSSGQAPLDLPVTQNGQTVFSLPSDNLRTILFVNGERADPLSYTISGATLTWAGYYQLATDDALQLV